MDFCTFPKDKHGYDAIFVVVDRFSKRPISIPCHKTITAKGTAQLFITHVYRWVGIPDSIVSDRGGQFISEFWTEFCRLLRIKRKLSTARHPQTDGQTEIMNQYIAQRLRPYVNYHQDDWSELLPIVDFAAAALPQDSTKNSPFMIERGYEPRTSFDWQEPSPPPSQEPSTPDTIAARDYVSRLKNIWKDTQQQIVNAQEKQRQQANRHRREEDFNVGDEVFVTTKHWNTGRPSRKLADLSAGPFRIIQKIGNSYRLELPDSIQVHPVFSPDKLRRATKTEPLIGQHIDPPPPVDVNDHDEWEVDEVLDSKLHYRKLRYRVKWVGTDEDITWYPAGDFKNAPQKLIDFHERYPDKPGPPVRLQEWIKAALNDEFLDDHPDDANV
jgi:transposase InsO family protein